MNELNILKKIREETGVSLMACKRALEKAEGDMKKALEFLKKEGGEFALKKTVRKTHAGVIDAYIHSNKKIGVLIELRSETDFVSRNPEFSLLAHDIAMHIAASNSESVGELLSEPFIKDPNSNVGDKITHAIQKFGEKIEVARFQRFTL